MAGSVLLQSTDLSRSFNSGAVPDLLILKLVQLGSALAKGLSRRVRNDAKTKVSKRSAVGNPYKSWKEAPQEHEPLGVPEPNEPKPRCRTDILRNSSGGPRMPGMRIGFSRAPLG